MKKLFLFILILFITSIGYSQTYCNYSRYVFPTTALTTGITWTETHDIRQSPMLSMGVVVHMFLLEYNTDKFTRYVDDFTIQQINVGYAIGFNNWNGSRNNNRYNKDYITVYVGRYWEKEDISNYLLQDKYVAGLRINSDIRNRFHLWGKIDTNLNIGIGVGVKIVGSRPFQRNGIKCR